MGDGVYTKMFALKDINYSAASGDAKETMLELYQECLMSGKVHNSQLQKKDEESAKSYFTKCEQELSVAFRKLGSNITALNADERLKIYHDFYRAGEEEQYENKITSLVEIGRNAGCESYQIEGEKAEAGDVLAVYLAADTANGYGTFEANTAWFTVDANGINLLTEIYWNMNEIGYMIEADESGPKKMLITAAAKDRETVAGEYNATD